MSNAPLPLRSPQLTAHCSRWLPWRCAAPGWLLFAIIFAAGVPLFLRMPLWADATLYDLAARNAMRGGVHYRDIFDTNPPGFVWLVMLVRLLLGWSSEAIRAVDLLVVCGASILLLRLAKWAGADAASIAWTAAALAGFYLYTSEFCHVQRDVWQLLPAAAAVMLRLRHIETARSPAAVFRGASLEAVIWACGCWVKPHLGMVWAVVWLASVPRLARSGPQSWQRFVADAGGQTFGLSLVAAAGAAWLFNTGAWPHYLEVNRFWNAAYWDVIRLEQSDRNEFRFAYFPPWSECLRLALPLAMWNVVVGLFPWRRDSDPRRFARAVLGLVLLAWFAVGYGLQRPFLYVHVPEVFLMFAVFAANRLAIAFWLVLLRIAAGLFAMFAVGDPELWAQHERRQQDDFEYRALTFPNAAFDRDRNRLWPQCFTCELPREVRRGVARDADQIGGADPVQLGAVEDFLREQHLRDGELLCWHDATHSLYLSLNLRPPIRFLHVGTAMGMGLPQRDRAIDETRQALPGVRFVVGDLHRVTWNREALLELDDSGLPWFLPEWLRYEFPFDQPIVFRSPNGRYLVHRVERPLRSAIIGDLDQPHPPPGWVPPREWENRGGWRD